MTEIKANYVDRYLIAISTLWYCWYNHFLVKCFFQSGANSHIVTFWEHTTLIFHLQGISHHHEKSWIHP